MKKSQQSKNKYGTMTATSDVNSDYQTQSSTADYGTMTAKFDANSDSGSKSQKGSQQQQAGGKKVQTSSKNTGH